MMRIPFRLDPRRLNLRATFLRPNDAKTSTRNTRGLFNSYAERWFAWIQQSGRDQDINEQDVSTTLRRFLIFRDDTIEVGWAFQYPVSTGPIWQIQTLEVLDEADRRYMSGLCEVRNGATVVAAV